jgi:hypothetical protein
LIESGGMLLNRRLFARKSGVKLKQVTSPTVPVSARPPLALLVPVGSDTSKPTQPVLQPIMVLRSQGLPFAVLLVTPDRAYIKAIAASDLRINDRPCPEHELTSGDRIGLGPVVYEFQSQLIRTANGHPRAEAFLASDNPSQRYALRQPIVMIGASEHSDVHFGKAGSKEADIAVVVELPDGHALLSLDSPPAFEINGMNRTRHRLSEGDIIAANGCRLRYTAEPSEPEPPAEAKDEVPELEEAPAPPPEPPVKRPARKPAQKRVRAADLSAWGPLAHAVISGQNAPEMDAAPEVETNPSSGRSWWLVILLVIIALAGGAALAWWKFGAHFWK